MPSDENPSRRQTMYQMTVYIPDSRIHSFARSCGEEGGGPVSSDSTRWPTQAQRHLSELEEIIIDETHHDCHFQKKKTFKKSSICSDVVFWKD